MGGDRGEVELDRVREAGQIAELEDVMLVRAG